MSKGNQDRGRTRVKPRTHHADRELGTGIKAGGKRRFVIGASGKRKLDLADGAPARALAPAAPDRSCRSDFTYIATDEGWLCLVAVIDPSSHQMVGWSLQPDTQPHPQTQPQTLPSMQLQVPDNSPTNALPGGSLLSAMGRQIRSLADVPRESLWAHMKAGWLHGKRFATQRQAMDETIDCVTLYNACGHQAASTYERERPQSLQADTRFASQSETA
jgi:putative transposase